MSPTLRGLLYVAAALAVAAPVAAQRPRAKAPRRAPAPPPVAAVARLRCWSERPEDCSAAATRVLAVGTPRAARRPGSGWTQDIDVGFRKATSLQDAAAAARQAVEELRPHRYRMRVSLQGGKREWVYSTEDATGGPPRSTPRLAEGTLRRVKEQSRGAGLELALAGAGGKVLKGTEHQVDGVLRNLAGRAVSVALARGCDLDVAVTPRGSDRLAALSPCSEAPETLRIAAADSFVFRGAEVPSDATGSFNVVATLTGAVDGNRVQLRTPALRIEFRKAGKAELADWTSLRSGCTPAPLPKPGRGELADAYMISLVEGVDADALARYLVRERRLRVTVSTPRYLRLEGGDADAAALACLAGVEGVGRDVEGKRE